jgi:hypothetical protein
MFFNVVSFTDIAEISERNSEASEPNNCPSEVDKKLLVPKASPISI